MLARDKSARVQQDCGRDFLLLSAQRRYVEQTPISAGPHTRRPQAARIPNNKPASVKFKLEHYPDAGEYLYCASSILVTAVASSGLDCPRLEGPDGIPA